MHHHYRRARVVDLQSLVLQARMSIVSNLIVLSVLFAVFVHVKAEKPLLPPWAV